MADNQEVAISELAKIRGLDDTDLVMLISEIHDNGWPFARRTLCLMPPKDEDRLRWLQQNATMLYVPRSRMTADQYLIAIRDRLSRAIDNGMDVKEGLEFAVRWTKEHMTTTRRTPDEGNVDAENCDS